MDDQEKKALSKHRKELCENIAPTEEFLSLMVQKGLLTETMVHMVKDERRQSDKTGKMLDILMNRKAGHDLFNKFSTFLEQFHPILSKKLHDAIKEHDTSSKNGLRREATDDTSTSVVQENRHDNDIKNRVGVITHKLFGGSKKMSEKDKRSVERWLGDQMQTERNFWKDEMERNARELEKQLWPKMYSRLKKINVKLIESLHAQNGRLSNAESDDKESDEVVVLENHLDRLLGKLRMLRDERDRCLDVMKVPPHSQHHRLDQLIMVVKKTYKEKIYQIQVEGDERSERLEGELQCYAEHMHDLEQTNKTLKSQVEQLEKQLRELKIEKSKIEEKCANVERHNTQLQESDLKILRFQNTALEERCAALERLTSRTTNSDQTTEAQRKTILELQKQLEHAHVEVQSYKKVAEQNKGARFQRVAALAIAEHKKKH